MELQTSLALIHGTSAPTTSTADDGYDREPFRHPALEGLDKLTEDQKLQITKKSRLSRLGERYGLDRVMRWKPKKVCAQSSGQGPECWLTSIMAGIGSERIRRIDHHYSGIICDCWSCGTAEGRASRE